MAIVSMNTLLHKAQKENYAVGYFESFNMDSLFGVLDAAEDCSSPVIIGFGGQFLSSGERDRIDSIYPYGALAREAARQAKVPVAVILNESNREDMIYRAMNAGFNTVMYQKQGESMDDTLRITKEICRVAHMLDIEVESEVGELPNADIGSGTCSAGSYTDVEQAVNFVAHTGVDALAVSVGNVHLLEGKKAAIDFDLLACLRENVPVPLVLHGGTGVAPDEMQKAIAMGVCKINVGTVLKRAYINAVGRFYTEKNLEKIDPHVTIGWGGENDMISSGRKAIADKTAEFMTLLGSVGKARQ